MVDVRQEEICPEVCVSTIIPAALRTICPAACTGIDAMKSVSKRCSMLTAAILLLNLATARTAEIPTTAALHPLGLEVAWTGQATLDRARDQLRHVHNDEELLYVQSSAGVVSAFHAESGRRMWVRQVGRNDEQSMRAVSNSEHVLILAGPVAWGLDKFTGDELFQFRLPGQPAESPAINDESFFVSLSNGTIFSYAIETLKYQERYNSLPPKVALPHSWRFVSSEGVRFAPITLGESLIIATEAGSLHSLSMRGESFFQNFLSQPLSAPLTIDRSGDRNHVIVITKNNYFFSIDMVIGDLAWSLPVERSVMQEPLVVENRVYAVVDQVGATCISGQTGQYARVDDDTDARWIVRGIKAITGINSTHVFGIDRNHRLVAVERLDARIAGRVSVNDYRVHHMNSLTDRLYLVSTSGELLCLKPANSEFAEYHQRPGREPLNVSVPLHDNDIRAD